MRLFYGLLKVLPVITLLFSSSLLFAYDYPVVGEFNAKYQKVFDSIKAGRCNSMGGELKDLADSEGISSNIYLSICYFEKGDNGEAFKVFDTMLAGQEYDEVLYVTKSQMDKGNSDLKLLKYRGLAYFNIGAYEKALVDFNSYLAGEEDADARFSLVDIYTSLKRYDDASAVLAKSQVKDGRYYYRMGRIAVMQGNRETSLRYLRMVSAQDEKVYPAAKLLIGEICAGSRRYLCAEDEYKTAAGFRAYKDMAGDKLDKLEKSKKLFTGFINIGEQYDTNVTSIDPNEIQGASEIASARTFAMADLKLNFFPSFADRVSVGLMNYATWNDRLPSYDMSTHRIYTELVKSYDNIELLLPRITAGITYFNHQTYSKSLSAEAAGTYKMDTWSFKVPLKVTHYDYKDDTDEDQIGKDGYKYQTGLTVTKRFLKKFTAKAGGGYAIDRVKGEQKKKRDLTFDASLSMNVTQKLIPTLAFSYADYDYKKTNRNDDYYSYSLKAVYILTPHIFLGGGVTWIKTNSNENAYDYTKTISEVSVSYSF